MAFHNPDSAPVVYDDAGHIIDGHGRVDGDGDQRTQALIDAGVLVAIEAPAKKAKES